MPSRPWQAFFQRVKNAWVDTRKKEKDPSTDQEEKYSSQNYLGSFRKGLPTKEGRVSTADYLLYLQALKSKDFSALQGKARALADPLGAYYFDNVGTDSSCTTISTAPWQVESVELAKELEYLYALSLARDIPFTDYPNHPFISTLSCYYSTTPDKLFRKVYAGPFLSQFLLLAPYKVLAPQDYLTTYASYDLAHSGTPNPALNSYQEKPRYLSNLRDLASYTFYDYPFQAYLDTVMYLSEKYPKALLNPYKGEPYNGFLAFNIPFVLDLISKSCTVALKTCWYHKWLVYRYLRPEEMAYEVDRLRSGRVNPYYAQPNPYLMNSPVVKTVAEKQGNVLLSQTFAMGAPFHPSFPSGHCAIAGSAITIMKALYDTKTVITDPKQSSSDGSILLPYQGTELTLGEELEKLAHNIGLGRESAGVHYPMDDLEGFRLGEQVALRILRCAREDLHLPEWKPEIRLMDGSVVQV